MKPGWETHTLGELCTIVGGGTPPKDQPSYYGGIIPWATVRDMRSTILSETEHSITDEGLRNSAANVIPKSNVVIASRVGLGKVCWLAQDTAINQDLRALIPRRSQQLNASYLLWLMQFRAPDFIAAGRGATVQGVTLPFIASLEVPVPPLAEQQQIVDVLDEAFVGLATATANVEQILTNAREVLSRAIDDSFVLPVHSHCSRVLSEIIEITHGYAFNGAHFTKTHGGDFPIVLTPGNYTPSSTLSFTDRNTKRFTGSFENEYLLQPGDLTVVMTDLSSKMKILGKPAFVDRPKVLHNQRIGRVVLKTSELNLSFLYYFLRTSDVSAAIKDSSTGTMVRHTAPKRILSLRLPLLSAPAQQAVVDKLRNLERYTSRLEAIVQERLTALAELKASLLHRAFSGELVNAAVGSTMTAANDDFTTPETAANVIAFAQRRHEIAGTERTFGRVKAQKVLQLVETVGRIDLGRQPVKDAAGPNDFPHMLRAQEWAETKRFFTFVPRHGGTGFDFKKLADYDAMWARAQMATWPISDALGRAIEPVVLMKSLEAELLATVQAAWNNLILDEAVVTDDAIAREARENWHIAKMKIPGHKFFDAIKRVRALGIVPDGTAKRVGGQERLL